MSVMFEVLYKSPPDPRREAAIADHVGRFGGRLTHREEPAVAQAGAVCLTYEFDEVREAEEAATRLRSQGEHVEGPTDYGD